MANIALAYTFAPSTVAKSAEVNANFTEVRDKFNTYAVQTDVAKTITAAHTHAADLLFTDALYDIGKSGATRPRDGFFSRNMTVGNLLSAGEILVAGGIRQTGSTIVRIENTFGLRPSGSTGVAGEMGVSGGQFWLQSSNELGAVAALRINANGLLLSHAVTTNVTAGDIAVPNAKGLRGVQYGGAGTSRIAWLNTNDQAQIGDLVNGTYPNIGGQIVGSLAVGSAAANYCIAIDSTNNRFVYYSGGTRYYLAGTAF